MCSNKLGSAFYDPGHANNTYAEVLIAGGNSGSGNSHLVKLLIPTAPMDENGVGVFIITDKFSAGEKLRVIVNGDIQIESYF